jgi:hypothetical protein
MNSKYNQSVMKAIKDLQEEQERVIEICQFTWNMPAASGIWSFERDVYFWYLRHRPICRSVYLPLFWIAIWKVVHEYPKDDVFRLIDLISDIYNSLNSQTRYYTIASEVHCNKQSFPKLPSNVHVYGPGYNYGEEEGIICHQIPLLPFRQKIYFNFKRDIFCSYVISGEYRCRKRLNDFLYGCEGLGHDGFMVSCRVPYYLYCELLSRSTFVLTPRGTNIAVYRLYEALQYGAIPVYISDKYSLPYAEEINWDNLAILVDQNDIEKIPSILRKITITRIRKMQNYGEWFIENYINFNKFCERIFSHANTTQH